MPSNRRPHATARSRRKPGSDLCPAQTPRKAKPFQCGPRLTLIRPPVVNRESSPAAGCFPREKDTTWGPRGAADFISRAASDTVVCTKHLLRLRQFIDQVSARHDDATPSLIFRFFIMQAAEKQKLHRRSSSPSWSPLSSAPTSASRQSRVRRTPRTWPPE